MRLEAPVMQLGAGSAAVPSLIGSGPRPAQASQHGQVSSAADTIFSARCSWASGLRATASQPAGRNSWRAVAEGARARRRSRRSAGSRITRGGDLRMPGQLRLDPRARPLAQRVIGTGGRIQLGDVRILPQHRVL
ncbi:hypothetical protein [Paracoccus spongiarum]|uniref:Uncharacterized protein n=1 Tax=Paracoccus spongiarum TaxID=3064387 RepID=A0ABT9JFY5_9RHOB|nr:hypothetical protein [Paracoccus sp. 2205BS29-5]MDP5308718.1 hypothetical protein [Paracoccus sp. 2205BS29-5]